MALNCMFGQVEIEQYNLLVGFWSIVHLSFIWSLKMVLILGECKM